MQPAISLKLEQGYRQQERDARRQQNNEAKHDFLFQFRRGNKLRPARKEIVLKEMKTIKNNEEF